MCYQFSLALIDASAFYDPIEPFLVIANVNYEVRKLPIHHTGLLHTHPFDHTQLTSHLTLSKGRLSWASGGRYLVVGVVLHTEQVGQVRPLNPAELASRTIAIEHRDLELGRREDAAL